MVGGVACLVPFNGESNLEFLEPLDESEGHSFPVV